MTAQQIALAPPAIDPGRAHLYDENGVFYPEPDGEPMPDAEYQDRNIRSARYQLDGFYHDRPGTYVSGNTVIYYEQGNPRRNVSPDCYVAFNVDYSVINYHGSYWVWEMGKPPDFVLEVASESTAGNDTGRKMLIYAGMGAGEYWLFDRTVNGKHYGFRMAGYYLGPEGYEPFAITEDAAGNLRAHSPTLGLDICWEYDPALRHGIIRFYNPVSGSICWITRSLLTRWRKRGRGARPPRRLCRIPRWLCKTPRPRAQPPRRAASRQRPKPPPCASSCAGYRRPPRTTRPAEPAGGRGHFPNIMRPMRYTAGSRAHFLPERSCSTKPSSAWRFMSSWTPAARCSAAARRITRPPRPILASARCAWGCRGRCP